MGELTAQFGFASFQTAKLVTKPNAFVARLNATNSRVFVPGFAVGEPRRSYPERVALP